MPGFLDVVGQVTYGKLQFYHSVAAFRAPGTVTGHAIGGNTFDAQSSRGVAWPELSGSGGYS